MHSIDLTKTDGLEKPLMKFKPLLIGMVLSVPLWMLIAVVYLALEPK